MARTPIRHTNCPRCGALLASDNTTGRCAPCQAAERDRLVSPPTLPTDFWDHEPIRQALAERHLGKVIRAYRHHPYHGHDPLPQETVGRWLGITQAQMSRLENGRPVVHLDRLTHWARVLHIPGHLLWFKLPNDVGERSTDSTRDSSAKECQCQPNCGSRAAPDEGRRALLVGIAAVATAAGLVGDRPRTRRIGTADVVRLNAVIELYRSVDYEWGGGMLYREVDRLAEAASALLQQSHSEALTPGLVASVAAVRQLAGWTAFDAGRHSAAQRHFLAAERAAVAAEDALLAARVRYCQARQFQHLRHNRDALATLQLARAHLGSAATPAVSAMLHGAEAASLAALGDRQSALTALGKAHDEFDRITAEREPAWMHFYDRGELLAQYGRVYRDLARVDSEHASDAVQWVREAIGAFGSQNVRSTLLNEVGLCSALFLADDPQQALTVGARVIEHAEKLTSRRIFDRVRNLSRDLGRHRHLPEVAQFGHTLATIGPVAA